MINGTVETRARSEFTPMFVVVWILSRALLAQAVEGNKRAEEKQPDERVSSLWLKFHGLASLPNLPAEFLVEYLFALARRAVFARREIYWPTTDGGGGVWSRGVIKTNITSCRSEKARKFPPVVEAVKICHGRALIYGGYYRAQRRRL